MAPYDWSPYTSPDLCGIPSGDGGLGAFAPAQSVRSLRNGWVIRFHGGIEDGRLRRSGIVKLVPIRALQEQENAELFGIMSEELGDGELMARVASGDEQAFRQLIERHQDRVYGTVARMMGGAGPEVEEAAQDVFLRVWRSAARYRGDCQFTTWLMIVVRNLVFTRLGQRWRRKNIDGEDRVDPETGESLMENQTAQPSRDPSEALAFRELEKAVAEACAELPENQRLVVHLRQYDGMDLEEIVKTTGMSLTAVKALIFRARESLKKKLSGYLAASK